MLIEKIGKAAMLEQTAEECAELAKACLKYARALRQENPTPKPMHEIICNMEEETADVCICLNELSGTLVIDSNVQKWMEIKQNRIKERLWGNYGEGQKTKEKNLDDVRP